MRPLGEYLNRRTFDGLDNQILTHALATVGFHETDYYKWSPGFTFESIGLFPGCKDIVNYFIDNFTQSKLSGWDIYSKDVNKHLFFDLLSLQFDNDSTGAVHGEYKLYYDDERDEDKWDDIHKRFKFIDITLYNTDVSNIDDTIEILTHELQHAWDDYVLRSNGISVVDKYIKHDPKSLIDNIKDQLIIKMFEGPDNPKYNKYLSKDIPILRKLLYYLDRFEGSAYIAQMNGCLMNKMFPSPSDVLLYIKDRCPTYNNYKVLYELFNDGGYIKQLEDMGMKHSAISKYRKISNEIWKKVVNHTYHIILQHVKYNESTEFPKTFIKDSLLEVHKR